MDNLFNELYYKYTDLLNELKIGYSISHTQLNEMWNLIHKLHFIKYESDHSNEILNILEYYEYV